MAVRDRVRARLLPVLLREEKAREADETRLVFGLSAKREWRGGSVLPLPIDVIRHLLD